MASSKPAPPYVENLRTLTQNLKPTGLHWTSEEEDDNFVLGKPPLDQTMKDDSTRRNSKTPSSHETSSSSRHKPQDLSRLLQEREEMCQRRAAAQIDELQLEHAKMLANLHKETDRLQKMVFDLTYRLTLRDHPIEELKDMDPSNHTPTAIPAVDDVVRIDDNVDAQNEIVDAQKEELTKIREICSGKNAKIADLEQQVADLTLLLAQNKQKSFDRSAPPVNVTATTQSAKRSSYSVPANVKSAKTPTVCQAPTISQTPTANHPAPPVKAAVGHSRPKVTTGQSTYPTTKALRDKTAGQSDKVPVTHQKSTGGAISSSASVTSGKMTRTTSSVVAAAAGGSSATTTNQNHLSSHGHQPIEKRQQEVSTSKSMEMKQTTGGGGTGGHRSAAANKPPLTNQKNQQQRTKSWK